LNALLDLDSNKGPVPDGARRLHCHFVLCSSTGHWRLSFFVICGSSLLLPLF
jgi:hypothetical protein